MRGAILTVVAVLILTSGCLCCNMPGLEGTTTLPETTTTTSSSMIETTTAATSIETSTLIPETTLAGETTTTTEGTTTTTIPPESCSDGILNQDEFLEDCGGVCQYECNVFNLTTAGDTMSFQGYGFTMEDNKLAGDDVEYAIIISTPDGYADSRTMKQGQQSWIDQVKFRMEEGNMTTVLVSARVDPDLTGRLPTDAVVKTVGGQSCIQKGGGICTRSYNGCEITMINRIDGGGVRFKVKKSDGMVVEGTAYQNGTSYMTVGAGGVIVGVLDYVIPGGYSNLYVKSK